MGPKFNAFSALSRPQDQEQTGLNPSSQVGATTPSLHASALPQERPSNVFSESSSPQPKGAISLRLTPSDLVAKGQSLQKADEQQQAQDHIGNRPAFKTAHIADTRQPGRAIASQWVRPVGASGTSTQPPGRTVVPMSVRLGHTPDSNMQPWGQSRASKLFLGPQHSGEVPIEANPLSHGMSKPWERNVNLDGADSSAKTFSHRIDQIVEQPLSTAAATASAADAMRAAAQGRKLRDMERAQQDLEGLAEDRSRRLQHVDAAVATTVVSESELLKTCAALEIGRLMAPVHRTTPRIPLAFTEELCEEDPPVKDLVRTLERRQHRII
jgi:hypothetical protein